MSTNAEAQQGARVIFIPPPLYYAAGLAGGMAINGVVALPLGGRPATAVAGVVVAALGLALAFAGVAAMIRHRTTIVPHRPVATLLTAAPTGCPATRCTPAWPSPTSVWRCCSVPGRRWRCGRS